MISATVAGIGMTKFGKQAERRVEGIGRKRGHAAS
jgi:hypothetical protein